MPTVLHHPKFEPGISWLRSALLVYDNVWSPPPHPQGIRQLLQRRADSLIAAEGRSLPSPHRTDRTHLLDTYPRWHVPSVSPDIVSDRDSSRGFVIATQICSGAPICSRSGAHRGRLPRDRCASSSSAGSLEAKTGSRAPSRCWRARASGRTARRRNRQRSTRRPGRR